MKLSSLLALALATKFFQDPLVGIPPAISVSSKAEIVPLLGGALCHFFYNDETLCHFFLFPVDDHIIW
ncbi:hypothetical protein Bca52824_095827 [Brassica carinata]|uniref:Uncharacterized protein n=1 Tax=Brassica carinata TaxID=52824 RepID=A0A8X7P1G3_BRACI|nr:hypothetical protein Bca52824_095827 [Brassica carinata]